MNDELIRLFPPATSRHETGPEPPGEDRRRWMRRMLILMLGACAAFSLTSFWLSRLSNPISVAEADLQATTLVRAHLNALERGDLRAAYGQFSTRYRRRIPFEVFHEMILSHWPMFHSRRLSLTPQEESADRVVLDIQYSDGEEDSIAEFTLVRIADRWWIDDVQWIRRQPNRLIRT
jgi:hypothetical protein